MEGDSECSFSGRDPRREREAAEELGRGGRAPPSLCYPWHMRMRLVRDASDEWERTEGEPPAGESADNDVAPGHGTIGDAP